MRIICINVITLFLIFADTRVAENFHRAIESLSSDSPEWPIVIVATSPAPKLLTADIHEGFLHHVEIKV